MAGERPGLYFHVEFGVSWTPKQGPKHHNLTYMSKSIRHRGDKDLRQITAQQQHHHHHHYYQHQSPYHAVPYYSYNHAANPHPPAAQQEHRHNPHHPHKPQHYNQPQPLHHTFTEPIGQDERRRTSRSQSRSSHGRGRSAPPFFNDSPWDAEPEPMGADALPRRTRKSRPHVNKALHVTPGQFRLGMDGMPWSSGPYSAGYVEEGEVDDGASQRDAPTAPLRAIDDKERGRVEEMGSLATALMTVDNGFEDQWWFSGPRYFSVAGDLVAPADLMEKKAEKLGWAIAAKQADEAGGTSTYPDGKYSIRSRDTVWSPHPSFVDLVSPVSGSGSSTHNYPGLQRSLTTRSDDLHIYA